MKISVFGLGYVGCVTAACMAKAGHMIYGVDINQDKVEMLNSGRSPIVEHGLEELILEAKHRGCLMATIDPLEAVLATDVTFVSVGTPSRSNGSLNLEALITVSEQIGEALSNKKAYHCVVFRSTVLPGTVRNMLIPILTGASKREVHCDFDVCFNPEFLRQGSSISDFHNPPFTVIGQGMVRGGDVVAKLYDRIEAPVERTSYEVAEMLKYVCNSFHALKVTFANEIGVLAKSLGIDSHAVMELFVQDDKLNISSAYLKPGFAFGGSCLPKDLSALLYRAKESDVQMPLLSSVLESNRIHINRAIDWIVSTKKKKVGILGLSFKAGTDDLRESPTVSLVETLIGKGYQLSIYDSEVSLASIFGANKEFIEKEIPHISSLMNSNIKEVIRLSDVIVICKRENGFWEALRPYLGDKVVLDLVRIAPNSADMPEKYDSICW